MMMLPTGGIGLTPELTIVTEKMTSLTYSLDMENDRIIGKIDGLEAVKQAVFKILQTERYEKFIYSFDYGYESVSLIGSHVELAKSELKRCIREALLQDDRITDVMDFEIIINGDSALVSFTVKSNYGDMQSSLEVS